ncbi:MAG: transcription antitermination factor NusB [Terracidiphilus sp.]
MTPGQHHGAGRRKSRELAMQMLYQADIGKQTPEQVRATFWKAGDEVDPEVCGFAEDLFRVAVAHREQIDELLTANSKHWRLERMPAVDRNLLRMAVGEMLGFEGTPFPIVINEALEIGRRYCAPESINFLNGILDAIARGLIGR